MGDKLLTRSLAPCRHSATTLKLLPMLMRFPSPLIAGRLISRYKRFLADIELEDGAMVTAHCANPGSMLGLAAPGSRVWLSRSDKPGRKLPLSWELIEVDLGGGPTLVGINTANPNRAVPAAIAAGLVPGLARYDELAREVRYGDRCRIDILLNAPGRAPCYVEIKNAHLMRRPGLAEFPDSVTARGTKHLAELAKLAASGTRAVMLYLVQRGDAEAFALAGDIDATYAEAFDRALASGVEAMAFACDLSLEGLLALRPIPFAPSRERPGLGRAPVAHRSISP
jgi:sugar fermentation stimulation protein A